MARVVESDICVIGSGITAILAAERLSERGATDMVMVEAGDWSTPFSERTERRRRFIAYGENPWTGDHLDDQGGYGLMYRTMTVGGCAMHWDGATPRFSPEDFRQHSLYGIGSDWPLSYEELEPYYQDFEERVGVAGEQGPPEFDPRTAAYPMPPLPLSYNLERLKEWGAAAGIPFWTNPWAKATVPYRGRAACQRCDTCHVCPTGAKYTPDITLEHLMSAGHVRLVTNTLVRRLTVRERSTRIASAVGVDRHRPDEPVEFRARLFVLAGGYAWTPHLLLLSASSRFPDGLANSSGLVGRYMTGHPYLSAQIELPLELYPGIFATNSLLSRMYARPGPLDRYVRHDLRIWHTTFEREPRLRSDGGQLQFGDEVMTDWRSRARRATARVRGYYDVVPDRESRLVLDAGQRNRWGDPLPRIEFRDAAESAALRDYTHERMTGIFAHMARAGGGRVLETQFSPTMEHPGGGCRMGADPAASVTDAYGRTHDHENLFVLGAPTLVSGGCANGTPTFCALGLRSADEIARA